MPIETIDSLGSTLRTAAFAATIGIASTDVSLGASATEYGFARYCNHNTVQPQQHSADTINVLVEDLRHMSPGSGETEASEKAIGRAAQLLNDAEPFIAYTIPAGEIDCYFGEVGIEWRNQNRILRLTCFGTEEASRIDFGTMSKTSPGIYESISAPTPQMLAKQLDWIAEASVQTNTAETSG